MPRTLPQRPDFEQLKALARELQRAYNAGEPAAQRRVALQIPAVASRQLLVDGRRQATLVQAQLVLAREADRSGIHHGEVAGQHVEDGLVVLPQVGGLLAGHRGEHQRVGVGGVSGLGAAKLLRKDGLAVRVSEGKTLAPDA